MAFLSDTTYLFQVSDWVIENKGPIVLPPGKATFIDSYPGILKFVKLNNQNVFEDFTVHFPSERKYRYNGMTKDQVERIGEEQLIIRTIDLKPGMYAWVEYSITLGMGLMTGKEQNLTMIKVDEDEEYIKNGSEKSTDNKYDYLSSYDIVDGEKIYELNCADCHAEGVLNSPRVGDIGEWENRIKQGILAMIDKTIKGYKSDGYMPAKGGAVHLSNERFANAVAYMVYQSTEK
uniref:Cytochrome c class I n=1 Tax=Chlorobium phaeobacteroides (strain BS1) TaxID=331678 RepID=B3EJX0_CHLPB